MRTPRTSTDGGDGDVSSGNSDTDARSTGNAGEDSDSYEDDNVDDDNGNVDTRASPGRSTSKPSVSIVAPIDRADNASEQYYAGEGNGKKPPGTPRVRCWRLSALAGESLAWELTAT